MTILQAELKLFKAETIVDGPTNGGYRTYEEVVSGSPQSNFPHVFSAERAAGSTKIRFNSVANHNVNQEEAFNFSVWMDNETLGDDWVYFVPVTVGDTQADLTGSEDKYVVANLKTDITGGATNTIVVDCAHTSLTGSFVDGGTVRITNKDYPDSVPGTMELLTITGTPTVTDTEVSMIVTTNVVNSYTAAEGSRVSVVYETASVIATYDNFVDTTAGDGTFDDTTYPVALENDATIEETWTITFSDATNFTCSGARIGSVGAGTTGADFEPNNADVSKPYFSLPFLGFADTWANNDTIVFETHDSSVPIAQYRVVPAGAASLSGNRATIGFSCES